MKLTARANQVSAFLLHLPRLLKLGLVIFGTGAFGDFAYHLLPPVTAHGLEPLLGANAGFAHGVTFAGMILIFIGVLPVWGRHEE